MERASLHGRAARIQPHPQRLACIHALMDSIELGAASVAVPREVAPTAPPRWTLVAASFGLGMALLDVTAGNVAVPSIQQELGTGIAGLSWVMDGYTLAFASSLLLARGVGHRLGSPRAL